MKYDLQLISHCFSKVLPLYRAQLQYQVGSLFHYAPSDIKTCLTVVTTHADHETINYIESAKVQMPEWITLELLILDPGSLFRRAVGRNICALRGDARVYWFADVDYFFGKGCLTSLMSQVDETSGLVFPRQIWINPDHETGDRMTNGLTPQEKMFPYATHREYRMNPPWFVQRRQKTAIGGIHIVGRNKLLEKNPDDGHPRGYINGHRKCRPVDPDGGFARCRCDIPAKRSLGPATPVDIEGVFRIRHSSAGRCFDQSGKRTVEMKGSHD